MSQGILRNFELLFLIGVSFFGVFLMGVFAVSPPSVQGNLPWGRLLIGSVFSLICALGILAVLFPKACSLMFYRGSSEVSKPSNLPQNNTSSRSTFFKLRIVHGHHPNCEEFSAHEFKIGNRTFCTGCVGLLIGALVALVGAATCFFNDYYVEQGIQFLFLGILGVVFGILQYPLFNVRQRFLRLFLNFYFIFGMFLILIGIDMLIHSTVVDLFVLLLCVFWLFTRISLSQWDHKRICQGCMRESNCPRKLDV